MSDLRSDDGFADAPRPLEPADPFTAPRADLGSSQGPIHYGDATKGQRFLNLLLDYVGLLVASTMLGVVIVVLGGEQAIDEIPDQLFGLVVMTAYYVFFEGLFGRTPAKLITGTVVVTEDGTRPGLKKILGRTLARFVPFEPFSFLGAETRGWHDRWSGTQVVRLRPNKWERE